MQMNKLKHEQSIQTQEVNERLNTIEGKIDTLNIIHPSLKRGKSLGMKICKSGTFLGYILTEPVDTTISSGLKIVLQTYSGPSAKINSLRRHYNRSSEHFHGNAVDFAWDDAVIEYLLSDEGRKWLCDHGLCFYIEGRPGSTKVKTYHKRPEAKKYCFFNEKATGDHIHLSLSS